MSVEIKDLTAGYGDRIILKGLSLKIKSGRLHALLGKNGSGKTTLFRCISRLVKPQAGDILVEGKNINKLNRNEIASLISLAPQKTESVFSYSVLEMVMMGETARLKAWEAPGRDTVKRAKEACGETGITYLEDRTYNELSGGEQQLVLLARAIMQDTPIMLLDEPTSHLDFCNQHKVMGLLRKIVKSKGVTALITLHDPNIAISYCDDVVMINEGEIVASGKMENVFTDDNLKRVYGRIICTDYTSKGIKVVIPDFNMNEQNIYRIS